MSPHVRKRTRDCERGAKDRRRTSGGGADLRSVEAAAAVAANGVESSRLPFGVREALRAATRKGNGVGRLALGRRMNRTGSHAWCGRGRHLDREGDATPRPPCEWTGDRTRRARKKNTHRHAQCKSNAIWSSRCLEIAVNHAADYKRTSQLAKKSPRFCGMQNRGHVVATCEDRFERGSSAIRPATSFAACG